MEYMNFLNYPFKIIVADGGKDQQIEDMLRDKSNFSNLDYDYLRYPYDQTLDDFHEKMSDSIQKISTPLASIMDNDDFLLLEGVKKCVDFLKNNKDYSSARGLVNRLGVNKDIFGDISISENMYSKFTEDIVGSTASERVAEQSSRFHGNWHNVTRSEHLKAAWKMINIVKPQNMRFTEQMTGYLGALWGDSHRGDFPWLLHQHGQRIDIEGGSLDSHYPDQEGWIKSDYWLEEFNKMTEVVGVAISAYDNIPIDEAMKNFREAYACKLPKMKKLLESRINEAYKIGYNTKRIERLVDTVKEYNIKKPCDIEDDNLSVPPTGRGWSPWAHTRTRLWVPSAGDEVLLLQKFLWPVESFYLLLEKFLPPGFAEWASHVLKNRR